MSHLDHLFEQLLIDRRGCLVRSVAHGESLMGECLVQWTRRRCVPPPSSSVISSKAVSISARAAKSGASSRACFSPGVKGQIMPSECTSRSSLAALIEYQRSEEHTSELQSLMR